MNDIEILREINQNSKMGMDSLTTILKIFMTELRNCL